MQRERRGSPVPVNIEIVREEEQRGEIKRNANNILHSSDRFSCLHTILCFPGLMRLPWPVGSLSLLSRMYNPDNHNHTNNYRTHLFVKLALSSYLFTSYQVLLLLRYFCLLYPLPLPLSCYVRCVEIGRWRMFAGNQGEILRLKLLMLFTMENHSSC